MSTPRNLLEPIKAALGPERTMAFMELINALDLSPNDPELVLCAAMASFLISIGDFREWGTSQREDIKEMLATFVASVDLQVAGAFTRGADEFQTELRLAAREIAQSEYRAAASLRSQAITDEVEALKAATADLVRRDGELKARQAVTPGRVPLTSAPQAFLSPKVFLAIAAAFVIGWSAALLVLYPAAHHASLGHGRTLASSPLWEASRSQSSRTSVPSLQ